MVTLMPTTGQPDASPTAPQPTTGQSASAPRTAPQHASAPRTAPQPAAALVPSAPQLGAPSATPAGAAAPTPALRQFCADSAALDRAAQLLREADAANTSAERFELAHRASLRAAGVLVARANRRRRRPLPLNVWTALRRLGAEGDSLADAFAPLVTQRERLARDADAEVPAQLLADQRELAAGLIARVREVLLEELDAPMMAG